MNRPEWQQAILNAGSRDQWEGFAGHRHKLSELLGVADADPDAAPNRGRLCVLGAGNCNDLDLPALLAAHREVHLVDLDAGALARGVARQGVADHPSLRRYGGVDLTGMLGAIAAWSPRSPVPAETVSALAEAPVQRAGPGLPGPFDLVASTCLLRPLIGNAFHAVGAKHPQFQALVRAIRLGHLRLLTHLAAAGGRAILITDVASSDTCPELISLPGSAYADLLPRLVRDRSYFHGVNPESLPSVFGQDPVLNARVADLQAIPPWRWSLHARVYLVWALRYRVVAAEQRATEVWIR